MSTGRLLIRPATDSDLEAVLDLLEAQEFIKPLTREELRRTIDYPWRDRQKSFGLVVERDGVIGGFLGVVYSPEREYRGTTYITATLSHAFVADGFRWERVRDGETRGVRRIIVECAQRVMAEPVTCLAFSVHGPNESVAKILDDICHFERFAEHMVLSTVWSALGTRLRPAGRIVQGAARLDWLTSSQKQIVADHEGFGCTALVIVEGDRPCLVVSARRKFSAGRLWPWLPRGRSRRVPVSHILHISDPLVASGSWGALVATLGRIQRTLAVTCPESYVERPRNERRIPDVLRYYGRTVPIRALDTLYTEVALLP